MDGNRLMLPTREFDIVILGAGPVERVREADEAGIRVRPRPGLARPHPRDRERGHPPAERVPADDARAHYPYSAKP